jgi:sulfur carrier protein
MIEIYVNGGVKKYNNPILLSELLRTLSLGDKKVAIERNGEIVPRSAHPSTLVLDGDRLEIVVAVGGG